MGNNLIISNHKSKKQTRCGIVRRKRIIFLGSSEVGKSALINRLVTGEYTEEYKPTVEEIYKMDFTHLSKKLEVEIIDTSGSYYFPDMLNIYIKTADLIIVAFSCDSARSFEDVLQKLEIVDMLKTKDIDIVAVCSKADLDSSKEISYAEADLRLIEHGTISLIETSAKSNKGIHKLKQTIVGKCCE